jgi:membrane protein
MFMEEWKFVKKLSKRTFVIWSNARVPSLGAALAYYTTFSLAPLLLMVIAIAGMVFGEAAAEGALIRQFDDIIGQNGAQALQALIRGARDVEQGFLAGLIGFVLLILAATSVVAELRAALNIIWDAPPLRRTAIGRFLWARLLSLALIAVLGFLLLVSLIVSAALAAVQDWLNRIAPDLTVFLFFGNDVIFLALTALLFAFTFRFLPNKKIEWRNVWLGAISTALLFTLGKGIIALYIGKSGIANSFGAAGAIVSLLIWVYYTAQIFLLGATMTRAYTELAGSVAKKNKNI